MKKRILWVSEASFMATGFAVLSYEILKRLYSTEKYEIAELGSYASDNDPRAASLPWKFYGAYPHPNDSVANQRFKSAHTGQFGEAVFENVCLDFNPDIVVDVRDWWMCEFQLRSPFRDYYKILWMPTIDGEPQRLQWIDSYSQADKILTYSDYGKKVLEKEAPNIIKVDGVVRPGVNHEIYKPLDKKGIRKKFGIDENSNIIMTVMRNQKRKLFPDLIEMFNQFIKHAVVHKNEEIAKKTYLYLHTSYPDVGYDISKLIMKSGLGHKIYVTYMCSQCKAFYPEFFQSELTICKNCGALKAHLPNTQEGLSREELAVIMNLADAYIQYSICEGFGMPVAEAKACEVSAFATEYSATTEQVNVDGCFPIKVGRFFYESVMDTEQKRSLPDNNDAVKKLYNFFKLPKDERNKLGKLARKDAIENHSFDRSAKVFEQAIDSMEIHDRSKTWENTESNILDINTNIPRVRSNAEIVDWCVDNILHKPDLKSTRWRNDIVTSLNVGYISDRHNASRIKPYEPNEFMKEMVSRANMHNFWEKKRISLFNSDDITNVVKWELI